MKRQLQGIGIILFSIMMILGMGDEPVFDFHFRFSGDYMRRWDAFVVEKRVVLLYNRRRNRYMRSGAAG